MKAEEQLQAAVIKWKQRTFVTKEEANVRIESSNTLYPPQIDSIEEIRTIEAHLQLGNLYKEAYEILVRSQYSQMPMDDKLRMIEIELEMDKEKSKLGIGVNPRS